jgi:hypothetical protein
LIFSGSAFSKKVWEQHPFRADVATFEDKEWSKRVLKNGFDIEFVPAIFHYEIGRTPRQQFFRFKNDVVGNYQLWHQDISFLQIFKGHAESFNSLVLFYRSIRFFTFWLLIGFMFNKPKKFAFNINNLIFTISLALFVVIACLRFVGL